MTASTKKNAAPRATELQVHTAIVDWARLQSHSIPALMTLHHIPNGEKRTPRVAARLKRMGVLPGVLDLFLPVSRHGYHGLYIEVKSETGKLSEAQSDFAARVIENGYAAAVCYSLDDGINTLTSYLAHDVPPEGLITLQ